MNMEKNSFCFLPQLFPTESKNKSLQLKREIFWKVEVWSTQALPGWDNPDKTSAKHSPSLLLSLVHKSSYACGSQYGDSQNDDFGRVSCNSTSRAAQIFLENKEESRML